MGCLTREVSLNRHQGDRLISDIRGPNPWLTFCSRASSRSICRLSGVFGYNPSMRPQTYLPLSLLLSATLACSTVSLPGISATPTATLPPAPPTANPSDLHAQTLEAFDQAIRNGYLREDYDGVDWDAKVGTVRAQVVAGMNSETFDQSMADLAAAFPNNSVQYMSRAERVELEANATTSTTYQGIGVYFGVRGAPEPRIVVLAVIPGSPAEAAGLKAHDAILAIDGEPIPDGFLNDQAANRIRGEAGSDVTLTVRTPGSEPREVTITRGEITSGVPLITDVLPGNVFYARFPVVFGANDLSAFGQAYSTAVNAGQLRGLVIDLRIATGEAGWPLAELLTVFGNGDLGEVYTRSETQTITVTGQDISGTQTIPLMVLVGPDTRQEPELFAQFLQANGRAQVFGLPTIGDTEGFATIALPDGSRLSYAAQSYRDSTGADISITGLAPAHPMPQEWDSYSDAADPVLDAAMQAIP